MALSTQDQSKIREYLLGQLNDDEQQRIEERLMVDDELFQELEISKSEIIEEYRAGELNRDTQEWLESHYLSSPEGRKTYQLAAALSSHNGVSPVREPVPNLTLLERIGFVFRRPWILASVTCALLLTVVAVIWLSRASTQSVTGPSLASNLINRESGALPTKISLPANAGELRIRLLLPQPSAPVAGYRAELDDRTNVENVSVAQFDNDGVWVVIPARLLPRGEYSLKLVAITQGGAENQVPGNYYFNVE